MRISRIYLPLEINQVTKHITIEGDKAHYIKNVLRIKANHLIHFFIPAGIEYQAKISAIHRHEITLSDIQAINTQVPKSQLTTTLIQGISSSDRMDYSIQKAAELGCQSITPVLTDFCSQKIPTDKYTKKLQHWQSVAISACEQSGRTDLLHINPIQALHAVIEATDQAIYLEPGATTYISQLPHAFQQQQIIFIGPEGGFSPTEVAAFEQQKFLGVQLGYRVLRTETVAPVIMTALHTLYGDFKPPTE